LKNYFPTGHIKAVLDEYMYEDVQLFEDSTKSGSLFIQLAKPLAKIREEIDQIVAQHQELAKAEEEAKKQKKKAAKKPKEPARIDPNKLVPLPKKEKVIVPPPEPKPVTFSLSFSRGN
jgi:cell envelope opacity-associated protein A